ncbi:MAG: 50S ribosomal protein L6 [Kiritimatiellae bacterium]|nr:50S ribosomal protein L6 [Kiritimatiellia bacterium]
MSRVGQKPIPIPAGVDVNLNGKILSVKGPKGTLTREIPEAFEIRMEPGLVAIKPKTADPGLSPLHGLNRRLIANMVEGVVKGFAKELEIQGVGFKGTVQGRKLVLLMGYSRPIELNVPAGIEIKVIENVNIAVSGPDKQGVGDFTAHIRSYYPAEPYKGKGIRYKGEYIKRKVGKTVA